VNLPGRDKASDLAPLTSWPELVREIVDALCSGWVQAMPYALFGHSLGAWVAFEVAHELRARRGAGVPAPAHLFVSAKFAPQLSADERAHALKHFRERRRRSSCDGAVASAGGGGDEGGELGTVAAPRVAAADPEVFWAFNEMYGLPERLSRSPTFRRSFEKIFRADLQLSEAYSPPEVRRPLRPFRLPFWLRFTYVASVFVKKY
jgi:surfactin synthase thioesterase subunit